MPTTTEAPKPRRTPCLVGQPQSDPAMNALRHGLTARRTLLNDEDPAEFAGHVDGLRAVLSPVGGLEEFLVDRIAASSWRLRRLTSVEAEAFDRNRQRLKSQNEPKVGRGLGDSFSLGCINGHVWAQLSRYEAAIARQFRADLHELQRLQAARAGVSVPVPTAVDVTVHAESAVAAVALPPDPR